MHAYFATEALDGFAHYGQADPCTFINFRAVNALKDLEQAALRLYGNPNAIVFEPEPYGLGIAAGR